MTIKGTSTAVSAYNKLADTLNPQLDPGRQIAETIVESYPREPKERDDYLTEFMKHGLQQISTWFGLDRKELRLNVLQSLALMPTVEGDQRDAALVALREQSILTEEIRRIRVARGVPEAPAV
jgi:hypothetical protein